MPRLKPELSINNQYHIDKNRYYELKYFCLQYPVWKDEYYSILDECVASGVPTDHIKYGSDISDSVCAAATRLATLDSYIKLVESCAIDTDEEIGDYILRAVTEGDSFKTLCAKMDIPFGRDLYYDRYRKFFSVLNARR